ncbi:MAG TPA: hypothetical protein VNR60_09305 [Croceibacterium sp.]|nr:hypothetical protein [Croceibacterium sp.]
MPSPRTPSLQEQIAATQDWWRLAGVDMMFSDDPKSWLADQQADTAALPVQRIEEAPAEPPPPSIGGESANWPTSLEAFSRWWLEEPTLDRAGPGPRLAPRGPQGAPLAIVVPMPEAEDSDTLLSGRQGQLIVSMARAMGFDPDKLYLAAALPSHDPVPDWPGLGRDGMGDVLRHHLSLAAPERLIVLGRDILPLLSNGSAQPAPPVGEIEIQGGKLPLMTSYSPARLLEQPRLRKGLWQQWLDWTEGNRH